MRDRATITHVLSMAFGLHRSIMSRDSGLCHNGWRRDNLQRPINADGLAAQRTGVGKPHSQMCHKRESKCYG
jgi:hypothetical protein